MPYASYLEAHERLNLPGSYQQEINGSKEEGLTSLKLTDHKGSYNRYTHSGRVIYYVGEGRRKSPGHPAGNQMENNQELFRQSWNLQNLIPMLHKRSDDTIVLLGYYRVSGMCKRMGHEGFTYFEFELKQETDPLLNPKSPTVPPKTRDLQILCLPPSPTLISTPAVPEPTPAVSVTACLPTTSRLACYRCNIIKNLFDESSVKGVTLGEIK